MTASYDPAPDWRRDDRDSVCRCGHDDLTHTASLAVGGLTYGECFAQAAGQPVCPCTRYAVSA